MPNLPTGTVTFLFTDIEGSTTLLQRLGDRRYGEAIEEHRRLLHDAFAEGHGQVVDTQGDAFLVAFSRARDAVATAVAAQQALTKHNWPDGASLRVRMGLHTGEPLSCGTGYVGIDVHRAARIAAAGHGGQILVSDVTHGLVARDLPEGVSLRDLGEHRLKDLTHPDHLFQVVATDLPADFPAIRSLDVLPNNLPRQLTSFIGREKEMAEIKRLLSTAYLVTLTGSGGAGKTRLALQVAADVVEDHRDGVWFAEFAPIADPALVPRTVASALNVPEQPGRDMTETLVDALRPKALLLLLDNCEHLLAACSDLAAALLRKCPQVRILTTSREGLGVPGETLWRVPSLSLPDTGRLLTAEDLVLYEAVRLFVDRAVATTPGFSVTSQNAPAVAQVCQRLDGIPLAIELAAARVKVLAVEQIAARLDDRFRLLTGGSRTLLPRQQTLRATLDWSYRLLSDQERTVLRRLSGFAGGWTLEAAEAVCAGDGIEVSDILDLLTQLVDKSLVVAETQGGEARYRLLETVRQYSRDRLVESGESDRLRSGHLDFFLKQAEAVRDLSGPARDVWPQGMETEHDNIRTALEWSWAKADKEATLRLVVALESFWALQAHWTEGRKWSELALTVATETPSTLRADALHVAGWMANYHGDFEYAIARLEESLALHRELGNQERLISSLNDLGNVVYRQGDYGRAQVLLEESLELIRKLEDKAPSSLRLRQRTWTTYLLGIVARLLGDYEQAEKLGRESLALSRESGQKYQTALRLDSLGLLAYYRGDYPQAQALCEEGLALHRDVGHKFGITGSLNSLALVACAQGDYKQASALCQESLALSRETRDKGATARSLNVLARVACAHREYERGEVLLRESLTLFREMRNRPGIMRCLDGLADVARRRELPERAARIFGVAENLRESIGAALPLAERLELDQNVFALRAHLGDAAFASAWTAGRAMTVEQAIEYALAVEAN